MDIAAKKPRRFLTAFTTLLFVNFLFAAHHFSIGYVNSSFLGQFFSPQHLSLVYILTPIVIMLFLARLPNIVLHVGVWRLSVVAIPLLFAAVLLLGFSVHPAFAVLFFILQSLILLTLRYVMDLYVESLSNNEQKTGNTRSLFITAGNIGVFVGPLIASVVIIGSNFSPVYIAASLILVPAFFIVFFQFRHITPRLPSKDGNFLASVKEIFCCRLDIRRIMTAHFLIQLFFAGSIIYTPLYLFEVGGWSWQAIGTLSALSLLPYLILEIPFGILADRAWGEKEITIAGLGITGVALMFLSIIPLSSFLLWSAWYIVANIGGALAEVGTESYFFKQVNEENTDLIGSFRMLRPLGGIAAPIIAFIVLLFFSFQAIFAAFGVIVLTGIFTLTRLQDTR